MDRGKRGIKRSTAVDARGIPLGSVSAPANRHDSPLLVPTLERASESVGRLPERASVHLERAYDSNVTRQLLEDRGLVGVISEKGKPRLPCKPQTGGWWNGGGTVVERTHSWSNAHKKLLWCTERRGEVIDFWVAFSDVVIVVRGLIREGWSRYRWESRPPRRP